MTLVRACLMSVFAACFVACFATVFSVLMVSPSLAAEKTSKIDKTLELNEALSRIDRLEAQIVEMQSVIGALQTLLKKGAVPAVQSGRDALERQGRYSPPRNGEVDEPLFQSDGWGADARSSLDGAGRKGAGQFGAPPADFGDRHVPARSTAQVNGQSPRALYDAGYNYMMASDYKSAEATFKAFLSHYPNDALSGHAHFMLGDVYYLRGDYNRAASTFLKGYKTYKSSPRAPNNLLKLGLSLEKLGQAEAACQTYRELAAKYKRLPGHMMRTLSSAQSRAGCKI